MVHDAEYLTERGYQFTEIDVDEIATPTKRCASYPTRSTCPRSSRAMTYFANFDTDQLEAFLKEHGIEP